VRHADDGLQSDIGNVHVVEVLEAGADGLQDGEYGGVVRRRDLDGWKQRSSALSRSMCLVKAPGVVVR